MCVRACAYLLPALRSDELNFSTMNGTEVQCCTKACGFSIQTKCDGNETFRIMCPLFGTVISREWGSYMYTADSVYLFSF